MTDIKETAVTKEPSFIETGRQIKDLTSEQKASFCALSKELFGATSRWIKLIEFGRMEQVTEEVTEFVPGEKEEDEGTTRQVQVPVKHKGVNLNRIHRFTVDEVEHYMSNLKVQLEAIKTAMERQKEEQVRAKAQKELADQELAEAAGSAV